MSTPRRSFWFSRPTTQAQIETLLIGAAIWLSIFFFQLKLHVTASGKNQWESSFYVILLCLSWFILRIASPQRILQRLLSAFIVSLSLLLFYTISIYLLLSPNTSTQNAHLFYSLILLAITISIFFLASLFHECHIPITILAPLQTAIAALVTD
jgi:hypothetical protein